MTPFPFLMAFALTSGAAMAQDLSPRILDQMVVTKDSHPDLPLREVSGLFWDEAGQSLLAVSDRNDLYRLTLGTDDDRIALSLVARMRLSDADGERLRGKQFGAEGMAPGHSGDGIAIISEAPPRLALFDAEGRLTDELALPDALTEPGLLRSKGDGLESLALHSTLGYLFAPEVPLDGEPRRTHVLYGEKGPVLAFLTGAAGSTSIKGLETLPDGRLIVLERDRLDKGTIRVFLRVIDPDECPAASPCTSEAVALELLAPQDADFEGITWLGDDRLLIASDDRVDGQFRTVFALIGTDLFP